MSLPGGDCSGHECSAVQVCGLWAWGALCCSDPQSDVSEQNLLPTCDGRTAWEGKKSFPVKPLGWEGRSPQLDIVV